MSNSPQLTPEEARELIESIATSHGWFSRQLRNQTPEKVLHAVQVLRQGYGAAVRTLAEGLYRSQARFVFELIQNAEDNCYTRALSSKAKPYIKFSIHPDEIIVDSNEDGFTAENVRAICAVAHSTKVRTGSQYYIGEKGIGFKSVFMVASKVHIQSGPFSFFFEHEEGDSGMGMIAPEYQPPDEVLPEPLTRMTLSLIKGIDQSSLHQQFQALPDTFLLFLNKLGSITLSQSGFAGFVSTSTKYTCYDDVETGHKVLETVTFRDGEFPRSAYKHYFIQRKQIYGLPNDKQRDYNTAEIVLAFPVDNRSVPIIEQQYIYAYLPIRNFGFSFLIQSDFVTQASRQDVMESPRNKALLGHIAETFVDSIVQLCEHLILQYQWMRYLPGEIAEPFWKEIPTKIREFLRKTPVLRPRSKGPLRLISDLRFVIGLFKDRQGNPLVADLVDEIYLAGEYSQDDIEILKKWGLQTMDFDQLLDRVEYDLSLGHNSKLKSSHNDDDWHARMARVLLHPFTSPNVEFYPRYRARIQKMELIPLSNGGWTSIKQGPIHYRKPGGVEFPQDLDMRILDDRATHVPERMEFFVVMGATEASPSYIIGLIKEKHLGHSNDISLWSSVNHLRYIYQTACGSDNGTPSYRWFWLFDGNGKKFAANSLLYLQSDDRYGIQELTKPIQRSDRGLSAGDPGFSVDYIHPVYSETIPDKGNQERWQVWLKEVHGISSIPHLLSSTSKETLELSKELLHIAKYRSDQLLGMLKAHWTTYSAQMKPKVTALIGELEVPSMGIMKRIRDTFLPSKQLLKQCSQFLPCDQFPFLELGDAESITTWTFLQSFGVGVKNDLRFYLALLEYCISSNTVDKVYKLYESIERSCYRSDYEDVEGTDLLKKFFSSGSRILGPARDKHPSIWYRCDECLWEAPSCMLTKLPLQSVLGDATPTLTEFLHNTLRIPNACPKDLTGELRSRRLGECIKVSDPEHVRDLYRWLDRLRPTLSKEELDGFRSSLVVFSCIYTVPDLRWRLVKECVWSSEAKLKDKFIIGEHYKGLKGFFVGFLGVQIPDLGMFVGELKKATESSPPQGIEEVKSLIWQVNTMRPVAKDLEVLAHSKVFPVKLCNGVVEIRSKDILFAISDRKRLRDTFDGLVDFLDFSLEEVHKLRPFLYGLGLEDRYLSRVIVEKSSFEGGLDQPTISLTNNLRYRAQALFRCAVHFNSPRAEEDAMRLYKLLLHSKVFETNGITSQLEYPPSGISVAVENSRLHVTEDEVGFRFYVPKDLKERELCYLRLLPGKLLHQLINRSSDETPSIVNQVEAVTVISDILKSSDLVLDDVLEDAGIVAVSFPEELQYQKLQISEQESFSSRTSSSPRLSQSERPASRWGPPSPRSPSFSTASTIAPSSPLPQPSYNPVALFSGRTARPSPIPRTPEPVAVSPPAVEVDGSQAEYLRLLTGIVSAARNKRGGFPSKGSFNLNSLLAALPSDQSEELDPYEMPFGVRSENQILHDIRIGAAGELYAFEILSHLKTQLSGFTRQNWASTIRKHVTVHPDYHDMDAWRGAETADIVYKDTLGEFTKLLIENGYLDHDIWKNARPKYYLEVKTTTKEFGTRFFLSKSQYLRMQRVKLQAEEAADEVYIILRVFKLGEERIDMRVLVDPEGMRERGELSFVAESYSVVAAD